MNRVIRSIVKLKWRYVDGDPAIDIETFVTIIMITNSVDIGVKQ